MADAHPVVPDRGLLDPVNARLASLERDSRRARRAYVALLVVFCVMGFGILGAAVWFVAGDEAEIRIEAEPVQR